MRLREFLSLRRHDLDLTNCLLTVMGKGQKERIVPFSPELRKHLYRFMQLQEKKALPRSDYLFIDFKGTQWERRNSTTTLHLVLRKLGIPACGWHRLRHTFATHYLRNGGDLMRLSMTLGHAKVTTTQIYLHLVTEDLQVAHARAGIFSRLA